MDEYEYDYLYLTLFTKKFNPTLTPWTTFK
jgi:hypothetical protein